MNYITDIGYDKGDDHYHCSFYAKRILIIAFSGVHVKDKYKPWIGGTNCGMNIRGMLFK